MKSSGVILREVRNAAALSQRELARRAGTSQSAIARYEGGTAIPSWETLQRLAAACGRSLTIVAEPAPDQHDIELSEMLLDLTPEERLRSLSRYARLGRLAQKQI